VYRLRSELLALHSDEHDLGEVLPLVRARGLLPHARVGEVELARQRAVVEDFAERLAALAPGEGMPPLPVDLTLGPIVLEGTLHGVARHGLVDYRLAKAKPRDQLLLWIRHLVMHLVAPPEVARRSVWLGNDRAVAFGAVHDALAELTRLGALFHEGMHRLLPLFPATSLRWVEEDRMKLIRARETWEGTDFVDGEADEPHLSFAWREQDPFDAEFETLAQQIMGPLVAHRSEEAA
jgi:exodeoxyribonuclease V gamma subunit